MAWELLLVLHDPFDVGGHMMKRALPGGFRSVRRDRLIQEQRHDTYRSKGKLREPTACPGCGEVYRAGMWRWETEPERAHFQSCPACLRIADDYPAGFVTLRGGFLADHLDEILNLVRNEEAREKIQHALERIMKIETQDDGVLVTTTDIHLARRIGESVHHAYAGDLEYHYQDDEHLLHVNWIRETI